MCNLDFSSKNPIKDFKTFKQLLTKIAINTDSKSPIGYQIRSDEIKAQIPVSK